ncbi:hypothetical protein HELRODRAFT_164466 [Helobdella robusta]|uniref:Uncharacterized protein n=1 Tax=Helobdella robusta TaxID=6412 RepID=T1EVG4_HELRO|nr:hypothetical protein HELRODRAFT_164466 [Helobdella robusta]ESN94601.1 hypothetical protein HELRODRAFT_164466 [Helobdella robusta]
MTTMTDSKLTKISQTLMVSDDKVEEDLTTSPAKSKVDSLENSEPTAEGSIAKVSTTKTPTTAPTTATITTTAKTKAKNTEIQSSAKTLCALNRQPAMITKTSAIMNITKSGRNNKNSYINNTNNIYCYINCYINNINSYIHNINSYINNTNNYINNYTNNTNNYINNYINNTNSYINIINNYISFAKELLQKSQRQGQLQQEQQPTLPPQQQQPSQQKQQQPQQQHKQRLQQQNNTPLLATNKDAITPNGVNEINADVNPDVLENDNDKTDRNIEVDVTLIQNAGSNLDNLDEITDNNVNEIEDDIITDVMAKYNVGHDNRSNKNETGLPTSLLNPSSSDPTSIDPNDDVILISDDDDGIDGCEDDVSSNATTTSATNASADNDYKEALHIFDGPNEVKVGYNRIGEDELLIAMLISQRAPHKKHANKSQRKQKECEDDQHFQSLIIQQQQQSLKQLMQLKKLSSLNNDDVENDGDEEEEDDGTGYYGSSPDSTTRNLDTLDNINPAGTLDDFEAIARLNNSSFLSKTPRRPKLQSCLLTSSTPVSRASSSSSPSSKTFFASSHAGQVDNSIPSCGTDCQTPGRAVVNGDVWQMFNPQLRNKKLSGISTSVPPATPTFSFMMPVKLNAATMTTAEVDVDATQSTVLMNLGVVQPIKKNIAEFIRMSCSKNEKKYFD